MTRLLWFFPVAAPVVLWVLVAMVRERRARDSKHYRDRVDALIDEVLPRENAQELWRTNREGMRS